MNKWSVEEKDSTIKVEKKIKVKEIKLSRDDLEELIKNTLRSQGINSDDIDINYLYKTSMHGDPDYRTRTGGFPMTKRKELAEIKITIKEEIT